MIAYKLVRVSQRPRRWRWLTWLRGPIIVEQIVGLCDEVHLERRLNTPGRTVVTIRDPLDDLMRATIGPTWTI